MDKVKLVSVLTQLPKQCIFFGPQGFNVYIDAAKLDSGQIGYSIDKSGHTLCGESIGQWQPQWYVIAQDTEMGDPYFVDSSDVNLPVYTGFYGENGWQTELVAVSMVGFVKCLETLFNKGQQNEAVFVADENTIISPDELNQLQRELEKASESKEFWVAFFACYRDWLSEDY